MANEPKPPEMHLIIENWCSDSIHFNEIVDYLAALREDAEKWREFLSDTEHRLEGQKDDDDDDNDRQ